MRMDITTPDDYMGEIVGDLQQRRALIESTEARGVMTAITAFAPLKGTFWLLVRHSLTQPRPRSCSMEPHGYQPAPEQDVESFGYSTILPSSGIIARFISAHSLATSHDKSRHCRLLGLYGNRSDQDLAATS